MRGIRAKRLYPELEDLPQDPKRDTEGHPTEERLPGTSILEDCVHLDDP